MTQRWQKSGSTGFEQHKMRFWSTRRLELSRISKCCLFSPSQGDHPPQLGAKGLSSWFRAAIDALAAHPDCLSFTTKGCPVVLTRSDLLQITDRTPLGNLILAQLAAITCHCKAKTTVVPSRQLSVDEVLILDNTPFGAKVIKDQDVTL